MQPLLGRFPLLVLVDGSKRLAATVSVTHPQERHRMPRRTARQQATVTTMIDIAAGMAVQTHASLGVTSWSSVK